MPRHPARTGSNPQRTGYRRRRRIKIQLSASALADPPTMSPLVDEVAAHVPENGRRALLANVAEDCAADAPFSGARRL
jgi:hypothetical protein